MRIKKLRGAYFTRQCQRKERISFDIMEAGLEAIDSAQRTKEIVRIESGKLVVGGTAYECKGDPQSGISHYDLDEIENIYVVGCGKGAQHTAKALEEILGDRLTAGEMILKHGDPYDFRTIHVTHGGHPVPDEGCVEGCHRILELSKRVTENDLVFTIAANGVSSLLTMPVPQVSLEDVKRVTEIIQIEKGRVHKGTEQGPQPSGQDEGRPSLPLL